MKNKTLNTFLPALVLFAITLAVGLILAGVNEVTEPIISSNNKSEEQKAMEQLFPGCSFEARDFEPSGAASQAFAALDDAGAVAGYVIHVSPVGFKGPINMTVGVSSSGKVIGYTVVSQSETAGLGSPVSEAFFIERFIGKSGQVKIVKAAPTAPDEVEALSGATISSNAAAAGVNEALELASTLSKGDAAK